MTNLDILFSSPPCFPSSSPLLDFNSDVVICLYSSHADANLHSTGHHRKNRFGSQFLSRDGQETSENYIFLDQSHGYTTLDLALDTARKLKQLSVPVEAVHFSASSVYLEGDMERFLLPWSLPGCSKGATLYYEFLFFPLFLQCTYWVLKVWGFGKQNPEIFEESTFCYNMNFPWAR